MMAEPKKTKAAREPSPREVQVSKEGMQAATGSPSIAFQSELLNQVMVSVWAPEWKSVEEKAQAMQAAYDALQRIAPRSELEGMLATQMIATQNAAIECLRRAMTEGQTLAGRDQNLKHATKLLGTYERQLAALDKHRGKGQQKITVEHLTVQAGGQAIVGNVGVGASGGTDTAPAQLEHFAEVPPSRTRTAVASSRKREPRR